MLRKGNDPGPSNPSAPVPALLFGVLPHSPGICCYRHGEETASGCPSSRAIIEYVVAPLPFDFLVLVYRFVDIRSPGQRAP